MKRPVRKDEWAVHDKIVEYSIYEDAVEEYINFLEEIIKKAHNTSQAIEKDMRTFAFSLTKPE